MRKKRGGGPHRRRPTVIDPAVIDTAVIDTAVIDNERRSSTESASAMASVESYDRPSGLWHRENVTRRAEHNTCRMRGPSVLRVSIRSFSIRSFLRRTNQLTLGIALSRP